MALIVGCPSPNGDSDPRRPSPGEARSDGRAFERALSGRGAALGPPPPSLLGLRSRAERRPKRRNPRVAQPPALRRARRTALGCTASCRATPRNEIPRGEKIPRRRRIHPLVRGRPSRLLLKPDGFPTITSQEVGALFVTDRLRTSGQRVEGANGRPLPAKMPRPASSWKTAWSERPVARRVAISARTARSSGPGTSRSSRPEPERPDPRGRVRPVRPHHHDAPITDPPAPQSPPPSAGDRLAVIPARSEIRVATGPLAALHR